MFSDRVSLDIFLLPTARGLRLLPFCCGCAEVLSDLQLFVLVDLKIRLDRWTVFICHVFCCAVCSEVLYALMKYLYQ